jgi:hypothetical protein
MPLACACVRLHMHRRVHGPDGVGRVVLCRVAVPPSGMPPDRFACDASYTQAFCVVLPVTLKGWVPAA